MQIIDSHVVKLSAYIKRLLTLFITLASPTLFAHGVAEGDKGYIQEIYGVHVIPFTFWVLSIWSLDMTIYYLLLALSSFYIE